MPQSRVTERDNFIWLLFGLVFLLFTGAVFSQYQSDTGQRLVTISITLTLLIAVWSMERNHSWVTSRLGLTLVAAGMLIGDIAIENRILTLLQLVFYFTFLSLTSFLACRQVLFSGNVDGNKIIGAICIYIMMGLAWAFAYLLTEEIYPGALSGLSQSGWHANAEDVIYFSFATITTLGYGDISPIHPIARFLAYMEATTGQFYIAILVASLIGARLSSYRPDAD